MPTLCRAEIRDLLTSLEAQLRPLDEVIVIYKCDKQAVNHILEGPKLPIYAYAQRNTGFTGAINQGLELASGDIVVFIDDDVILPMVFLKRYEELFERSSRRLAGFCSRDLPYERGKGLVRGPDDRLLVRIYRKFYVGHLVKPHPGLEAFKKGVFIDVKGNVRHGPCIPNGTCISLPFRGANMAFWKEAVEGLRLPEDPGLGAARGNEQLLGVMLASRGYLYAYVPNNPVLHLYHPSLSRSPKDLREATLMRRYILEALSRLNR